jgi:hypothetical protein
MFPDGVRPRPPMRPAQRSLMMSPYRLGITITSKAEGSFTSPSTALSMIISSYRICGCLSAQHGARRGCSAGPEAGDGGRAHPQPLCST